MALAITPTPERLHDGFTVLCPVGQLLLALKALLANQRFVPIDPAPLLATLASIVVILGHFLGRLEGWSKFDALYHAFITPTTVGYGDFHPSKKSSKVLAIVITLSALFLPASWLPLRFTLPPTPSRKRTTPISL